MEKNRSKKNPSRKRIIFSVFTNVSVIAVLAAMAVFLYQYMINVEEDNCWAILEDSAQSIEKEINIRLESNMNILKLVSGAMVREQRTQGTQEDLNAIVGHLNDFQSMTMFQHIDVLYGNGDILFQTGEIRKSDLNFKDVVEKGIHISGRMIDALTEKESIYCAVPIVKENQAVAVLLGVINCEVLPEFFESSMYDGAAFVCLVDRPSGDFIMDDWHDSLGNVYEMKSRHTLPGYEHIDVRTEVSLGHTGVTAYESNVNGKASYMYFQPVQNWNWQMIVVAQEDVVFGSMLIMKRMLGYMIAIVGLLLTVYLIWSVRTMRKALKNQEESERSSYMDILTGVFNQNKFTQTMDEYENTDLSNIGLLFLDLNGLKYTNDHFGHAAGDQLLKHTALLLTDIFGSTVYRIGGDEFVILTSGTPEAEFREMCSRAEAALQENQIEAAMGVTWHLNSRSVKAQLKEADDLMYSDKQSYHARNTTAIR